MNLGACIGSVTRMWTVPWLLTVASCQTRLVEMLLQSRTPFRYTQHNYDTAFVRLLCKIAATFDTPSSAYLLDTHFMILSPQCLSANGRTRSRALWVIRTGTVLRVCATPVELDVPETQRAPIIKARRLRHRASANVCSESLTHFRTDLKKGNACTRAMHIY